MRSEIAIAQLAEPKSLFDGPPQIGKRCHNPAEHQCPELHEHGVQLAYVQRKIWPSQHSSATLT
jgi:hypothetical protein